MKYLWLFWLPLLYLPAFSLSNDTGLGKLELSDFFIGPLLLLLYFRVQDDWINRLKSAPRLYVHYIIPILVLFLWWSFVSSVSLGLRYDYNDVYNVNFSILKVAKLFLYGFTSILLNFALAKASSKEFQIFLWSFLICGLLVGGGLLLTGNGNSTGGFIEGAQDAEALFGDNSVSALLSIMISFLIGMLVNGQGSLFWRRAVSSGLIIIILGFVSAQGRGGWFAAVGALIYIGLNINFKQTFRTTVIAIILISFAYNNNETFQFQIDATLRPNDTEESQALGVDDGGRLGIFVRQISLIINDPLFGRGLFHRGGLSGIYSTGSHNMFIQMFLETGIPGGLLVILLVRKMWVSASTDFVKKNKLDLPVKAAIIAAVISGQSGEYFYGGMVLFTLLLTYATVGRIRRDENNPFEHAI